MSERNPYSPPTVTVQDVQLSERPPRPKSVVIAVVLIAICLAYTLTSIPSLLSYVQVGEISVVTLVWSFVRWAAGALVCRQIWRGRNWARIALVLLAALSLSSLYLALWELMHQTEGTKRMVDWLTAFIMLSTPLVYLVSVYLVYVPGRGWFARRP